jgi:exosome complex component MTR3
MLVLPSLPIKRHPAAATEDALATASSSSGRRDGRALEALRPMKVRTGVVSSASGSAMLEMAHTKVLCSVFGPRANDGREFLQQGQIECSVRFAGFARRPRQARGGPAGGSSAEERALSLDLSAALSASVQLQLLPKSTIAVHCLVLQDDGGAMAAAVSCASLALADASIQLYGLVAACSCAQLGEEVALDCSATELARARGTVSVACMPALDQLTLLRQEGAMPFESVTEAMRLALAGCRLLHEEMAKVLREQALNAAVADEGQTAEGAAEMGASAQRVADTSQAATEDGAAAVPTKKANGKNGKRARDARQ